MTTPPSEVNDESVEDMSQEDMQRLLKVVAVIRKNMTKQGMQLGEVAAIGAFLLAEAVLESSEEDDHPREVFLSAVDMLDTAFACIETLEENSDEAEAEKKNEKPS